MLVYIFNRLMQATVVMVVVALLAFIMFQFVGDPINAMVGLYTTQEDRMALAESLGLNDPVHVQFLRFIGNLLQGEFGNSYVQRVPVAELIAERLPATLELAFLSAFLSVIIGIPLGVYAAIKRKTIGATGVTIFSLIGVSLPTFVIGLGFIMLFSVVLQWLPSFGRGDVTYIGWWSTGFLTESGVKSIILPAATLALYQITMVMRLVRSEMLEVLQTDYIKFCRARGLRNFSINFTHALKNTLVPVVTIIGLQLGGIIAFSVVTETVFQWPGMGLLFIQAVAAADIPVMSAYLVLIAFFFVLTNFVVDLLYLLVDPRLRVR